MMTNREKLESIKQMQIEAEAALSDPAIADAPVLLAELRETVKLCKKQYQDLLGKLTRLSYQ